MSCILVEISFRIIRDMSVWWKVSPNFLTISEICFEQWYEHTLFPLNHCQSLGTFGSVSYRKRSRIACRPICLALTREVLAVFLLVWDGFKLFSYQKAHSDILFEKHRKRQISQPPFNNMSWFWRRVSDLLPPKSCFCIGMGWDWMSPTTHISDYQSPHNSLLSNRNVLK